LDGNGKSIYNVTVAGTDNGIGACVFQFMEGTIKNLFVDMSLQADLINVKNSAFIYYMYANSVVENCYVKYASHATQYANGNGTAISPIVAEFSVSGGSATIRNCVGVMDLSAGVTHPTTPFGGAATIMGGIKNPNGAQAVVNLENCYGVMLTANGDTVHTAKLDSRDTGGNYGTVNKDTSSAYTSIRDMYTAATTGMTAANGWNSLWTVDTVNETLKFGNHVIYYRAPEMDKASAKVFLVKGTNEHNVAESVQLSLRYTDQTATWTSSDTTVATVSANGLVTPVKGGTALITATVNGDVCTCEITVYNYYEIDTVDEFMGMPTNDAFAYCVLTKDIDFSGIVINQTEGYMTVGYPEGAVGQVTPNTEAGIFAGVLDGNGYALQNVTIAPLAGYGGSNTCLGAPNLIHTISGTVKNLSAHISLTGLTVNSARFGGFAMSLSAGAHISNCYFELTSTHYVASNYPLAPLSGFVAANIGAITIENCVGVLNAVSTYRDGGLAGGLIGRISMANGGTVNVKNCYAVEVAPNDNTSSAQVFVQASGWQAPSTFENSTAYTTLAELLAAAKTGMTAEKGWNNLWTVTDTALKFGNVTIA
jgi:hypothetical protein